MPRLPRIHVEGGLYLVTSGGDRAELFRDDPDRQEYVGLLLRYKDQYKFKLHSYALIPGLIHLFIELESGTTISEIMHSVNSTYTKYYNARYDRQGHLFRGRFKAAVVEKERYMPEVSRLIHMLPVLEKITENAAGYKWSSYSLYLAGKEDAEGVLSLFSTDKKEQIAEYKKFVESATESELRIFRKKIQNTRIIGSDEFVELLEEGLREIYRQDEEFAAKKGPSTKILIITGVIIAAILAGIAVYSYFASKRVVNKVENILQEKETALKKEMEERYKQDMVSYYHAVSKKIEREWLKGEGME
ncbi:MAG: transposase [Candidatus Omnitrophota bacterium]